MRGYNLINTTVFRSTAMKEEEEAKKREREYSRNSQSLHKRQQIKTFDVRTHIFV